MGVTINNGGIKTCIHDSIRVFHNQLDSKPFWLAIPKGIQVSSFDESLLKRVTIHRWNFASALVVDSVSEGDIAALLTYTDSVYLNNPTYFAENLPWGDAATAFHEAGFRIFCSHEEVMVLSGKRCHATSIDPLEFLYSDQYRLHHYPSAAIVPTIANNRRKTSQTVFVLDLIQDAEILSPLIRRAAQHNSPFFSMVAVTTRVMESHIWANLATFFATHNISWFNPRTPIELVARFSREKALLITASESSAPGHAFCHQACRIAPSNVLRITIQHGIECVGLRHHKAHNLQFPNGIRFASDVILTWQQVDDLIDIHPAEISKCRTVGVIKSFAEQAAILRELFWKELSTLNAEAVTNGKEVLLAENLHSVRFSNLTRYQNFLQFIDQLSSIQNIPLTIRSHPGKRTLEKLPNSARRFLKGELLAESVARFSYFVSPPSTIVLDAVMALVPTAVWSDSQNVGDCANYQGLPIVTNYADWAATYQQQGYEKGLHWAAQNTASFNGADAAWATIINL